MPRADRARPRAGDVLWHTALAGTALAMGFPVLWAVLTSFKPPAEVFSTAPIADSPTWDNYTRVLADWPVLTLIGNTVVMAVGVALGQLVIAVLAAYAVVHLTPRLRGPLLVAATIALSIPPQAIVVPQFLLAARLGWQNSQLGLVVPQLGASAFAVLLLVQSVSALPVSLVEAARLEGARAHEVLWHVVLPGLRPAMAAVGILVFISTWNEYLWPLLIAPRRQDATVQIGLAQFQTEGGTDHGALMAAAVLAALPVLLVYVFTARRVTAAFLRSGIR